jgi:hypothetical protein
VGFWSGNITLAENNVNNLINIINSTTGITCLEKKDYKSVAKLEETGVW